MSWGVTDRERAQAAVRGGLHGSADANGAHTAALLDNRELEGGSAGGEREEGERELHGPNL